MEELKRSMLSMNRITESRCQIDIETFNRIEETLENYALAKLMKENADDDALTRDQALPYYERL